MNNEKKWCDEMTHKTNTYKNYKTKIKYKFNGSYNDKTHSHRDKKTHTQHLQTN